MQKFEDHQYSLRMSLEICGLHRQVTLEFVYQGKVLKWNRYMRVPLELTSIADLIDEVEL